MLPFLQKLHAIAAKRGDGLRPAFLNLQAVETFSVTFPSNDTELGSPLGDGSTSIHDKSQAEVTRRCGSPQD